MTPDQCRPQVGQRYIHRASRVIAVLRSYRRDKWKRRDKARLACDDGREWIGHTWDFWAQWQNAESRMSIYE